MAFFDKIFKKSKNNEELNKTTTIKIYDEEITSNRIIIFLVPNKTYQVELLHITKSAADKFGRVLYISLNKPAESIIKILKEIDIDTEKFLFIDAVNKKVKSEIAYHNTVLINSPENFKKFSIELNRTLEKEKFECVIFDSLSTMLLYQDAYVVTRFTHDLIAKLMIANVNGEFICLSEDINSVLLKDISMFADKVIDLDKEKSDIAHLEFQNYGEMSKLKNELETH